MSVEHHQQNDYLSARHSSETYWFMLYEMILQNTLAFVMYGSFALHTLKLHFKGSVFFATCT